MPTDRIFELRTYHAAPGKLDALNARFRDHTARLFARHGIGVIGFWESVGKDGAKDGTLVYLLAFPSREAAKAAWKEFQADPEWVQARAASQPDGVNLAASVESVYLTPTDYSPLR